VSALYRVKYSKMQSEWATDCRAWPTGSLFARRAIITPQISHPPVGCALRQRTELWI